MEANGRKTPDALERVVEEGGRYVTTTYLVFPGIEFSFVDAHGQRIANGREGERGSVLEIIYCREGRAELRLKEEFVVLSSGDLMIVRADAVSPEASFPLKHYHGLTIRIDLDKTPHCLSCFLADVNVQPKTLAEKFCGGRIGYVARANPSIEHIFSEIYSVSEPIRKGYCKIKTLELLLFLSQLNMTGDELRGRMYSRGQVLLAEKIAKHLCEHMDERITLEQLSAQFHISGAYIKHAFKCVYGVPVGAYIRTMKMESAAYLLEYTDKTILEIAMEHGYDNGSKFAAAFRAVKGMNSAQYRSEMHKKVNTIQTDSISDR